ncbi:MAG: PD40 domain-containing protein, partial [Acidobacteria bacterium]|nr:PD40 domain-containing protein [Acidobacteriota bacterium]
MLLARPGDLITREELRQQLWPSDTFVDYDQSLNAAVNRLRNVLGDTAEKPRFIETLPRRGYRFLVTPEIAEGKSRGNGAAPGLRTQRPARKQLQSGLSESVETDDGRKAQVHKSKNHRGRRVLMPAAVAGIFLMLAALVWLRWGPREPNLSSAKVVPFTSLPGQEVAPTFSPDGSQIAFAWSSNLGQGFDLYVKTVGSERMLKLTDRPSPWISPAWSPDGTQIAFARWGQGDGGIFMVPALGGPERRLASAGSWYEPFMQISWAPDGKSLAFSSTTDSGSHIFLLALDTLHTTMLNPHLDCWDAAAPSFSPDGKNLAFVCTSSVAVYGIYEMRVSGGRTRLLAGMMGYFQGLTWSRDGSKIIFANDSGNGGMLWQVTRGASLSKLPFGEQAANPSSASKGNRIAYVRGWKTINVWRLDLGSRHPEQSARKLIYSTRMQRVPQYSPDGKKIVFESDRSGTHEIWLADADGNNLVQLTSFGGPLTGSPSWCSDGHRIAFDSRASGSSALYAEDVERRVPHLIKADVQNLAIPTWSENCGWLFASDGHDHLYRVPAQGGAALRFSDKGSWFSRVKDGRVFFNVKEENGVSLWSRPVSGGES